ncbi:hypothetical protein JOC34_000334 [Virgibacillus halotolerans]|nr:hypothetical protein [Virgibacillus halotolerans]
MKFVTEQVVTYIDMPPDERKKRKTKQKDTQGMYVNRWFGVLPFVFKIFFRKEQ